MPSMNPFYCEIRELYLRDPFGIARGTKKSVCNLFLRIGEGWGEGAPVYYLGQSADEMLIMAQEWFHAGFDEWNPYCSNPEPVIRSIIEEMLRRYPGQTGLAQAVDLALYDGWGKAQGKPLHQLWGLDPERAPLSSFTIGIDNLEQVLEKTRRAEPYPILKIKVGGEKDWEALIAIHHHCRKPFYIDANEGWTMEQTLESLPKLAEMGVHLLEQPLPRTDRDGYRRLYEKNRSGVPIMIDEGAQTPNQVESWAGLAQGINVKLAKCGGLAHAREMIRIARRCGMRVMLGCMIESSLGITAAAHLASLVDDVDLDGAALLAEDPFTGMRLDRGTLVMPHRPGIGAEPMSPSLKGR